jgi:uncharacterized protein YndB with AHSA1/START domain
MVDLVAKAEIDIGASATDVWKALTDPDMIKKYFFGAQVETDWQPGHPIIWRGEYGGKSFEDKGEIQAIEQNRRLCMTHFSPMSGLPDAPENYHTLTFELQERGHKTHVSLTQDNNHDQAEADQATANWTTMLQNLERVIEGS